MIIGNAITPYIEQVKVELGPTNAKRLAAFPGIPRDPEDRYVLSDVFESLFPGRDKGKVLEVFKKFRSSVNAAAEEVGSSLRIHVDSSRTGDLTARRCWFEAEFKENPELQNFAEHSSRQGEVKGGQKSKGLPSRPSYRVFVSYAHADRQQFEKLMERMKPILKAQSMGKPYDIGIWSDENIVPGDHWREAINKQLETSHVGLVFLSPSALASTFIQNREIPPLIRGVNELDELRVCIPLMLRNFSFDDYSNALGVLTERQVYRYKHASNQKHYAWNQCTREEFKDGYVAGFVRALLTQVDSIHEKRATPSDEQEPVPFKEDGMLDTFAGEAAALSSEIKGQEKSRGRMGNLKELHSELTETRASSDLVSAEDYLIEWTHKESTFQNEFLAVLGEFGIGKTTTLHHYAQRLIDERASDPTLPLPLLFDLRSYQQARKESDDITLAHILSACLDGVQNSEGTQWHLTAEDIVRSVQHEKAIVIFDGLDEVMNALSRKAGQKFIKELWSILPPAPPAKEGEAEPQRPDGRGRIIMSCRSHFFRSVAQQNGIFVGQGRENVDEKDRMCLTILPFTTEQIRNYMRSCLGEQRGDRVFGRLEEIHNLLDLAERPVLLNMIREIVPDLEEAQQRGEVIRGVDLYERFLNKHMDRDEGKHIFTVRHKLRMMEALAADLWISGAREWEWSRLEEWLDEFLAGHPQISNRYGGDPETLNQDFRNATAVVRPAGEKERFRFAHTSLQEYFIACWMHRSLRSGNTKKWSELGKPSDETLDFLGQLLAKSQDATALANLSALMEAPHGDANLIGFRYLIMAHQMGYPQPKPQAIELEGADLYRWKVGGQGDKQPLLLRGLNLAGANLAESRWFGVRVEGGSFGGAVLNQSVWKKSWLNDLDLKGSEADGARFRECRWVRPVFVAGDAWQGAWLIDCTGFPDQETCPYAVSGCEPSAFTELRSRMEGHRGPVASVAYDGERGRYVSGSYDNKLKVWDAESLECVGTLEGHGGTVRSVAYDGERGRYVSGSYDNNLEVWDPKKLELRGTLLSMPYSQWAVLKPNQPHPEKASEGASEYLMHVGRDPSDGQLRAYPYAPPQKSQTAPPPKP